MAEFNETADLLYAGTVDIIYSSRESLDDGFTAV